MVDCVQNAGKTKLHRKFKWFCKGIDLELNCKSEKLFSILAVFSFLLQQGANILEKLSNATVGLDDTNLALDRLKHQPSPLCVFVVG